MDEQRFLFLKSLREVGSRARRILEFTRSTRSEFKMVLHQFITVQFPSHQFVWKVCSVQLAARRQRASEKFVQFSSFSSVHELFRPFFRPPRIDLPRFDPGSVQSIESGLLGKSRGAVLGPLQRKFQPAGPGFVTWVEGWCALMLSCLLVRGVMLCLSDANSV